LYREKRELTEAGKPENLAAVAQARAAELHDLKKTYALWHLAEVPAFYVSIYKVIEEIGEDSVSSFRGSPPLAFLQWLRENCWSPTEEIVVKQIVDALRSPAAIMVEGQILKDAWDVVVKLVLEGETNDAGRLLQMVGAKWRCKETAQLAVLLIGYPNLAESRAHSRAHFEAWNEWKLGVLNFRRLATQERAPLFFPGEGGVANRPAFKNYVAGALLDILCGDSWTKEVGGESVPCGLQIISIQGKLRLRNHGGTLEVCCPHPDKPPYSQWQYVCGAQLLYGTVCPLELGHAELANILRDSIVRVGKNPIESPEEDDEPTDKLLGAFVRTLGGEVVAPLELFSVFRQPWATPHLADLLWHAGSLTTLGIWPGWDAPFRPHLLLTHAMALPTYSAQLTKMSISYALAASSRMVLRGCGVRAEECAASMGFNVSDFENDVWGGIGEKLVDFPTASMLPPARVAKLALLSGASAAVGGVLDALLLGLPVEDERSVLSAVSYSRHLGFPGAAEKIRERWVQRCLSCEAGQVEANLGNGLAWALGCRGSLPPNQLAIETMASGMNGTLNQALQYGIAILAPYNSVSMTENIPFPTRPDVAEVLKRVFSYEGLKSVYAAIDSLEPALSSESLSDNSNSLLVRLIHLRELLDSLSQSYLDNAKEKLVQLVVDSGGGRELMRRGGLKEKGDGDVARLLRFAAAVGLLTPVTAHHNNSLRLILNAVKEEEMMFAKELLIMADSKPSDTSDKMFSTRLIAIDHLIHSPVPTCRTVLPLSDREIDERLSDFLDSPLGAKGLRELRFHIESNI